MQGYFHLEDDTKEHYNEERIPKERLDLHNILHIECDMENKSENGFIMIQLFMNPVSTLSIMYEFKIVIFGNGEPEYFLLLQQNFHLDLNASVTITVSVKIEYLCTLFNV